MNTIYNRLMLILSLFVAYILSFSLDTQQYGAVFVKLSVQQQ